MVSKASYLFFVCESFVSKKFFVCQVLIQCRGRGWTLGLSWAHMDCNDLMALVGGSCFAQPPHFPGGGLVASKSRYV